MTTILTLMISGGMLWENASERRDAKLYPPPGVLVDVGGRRLHLFCEGLAGGKTVVMIAGGGIPAVASYALQDRIARFARVCSYDRAGLGWSDPAPRPMSLADQAADLDRVLNGGGVSGPLVLAPESFGALIALDYARRYPGHIVGIVFIDGAEPTTWFATMSGEGPWATRLNIALMWAGWKLGVVRLALPFLEPEWVKGLPDQTRADFHVVFARPNPGWGDALDAYQHTDPADRPQSSPGSLGAIPVTVIEHGRPSSMVTADFEAVWPQAQARLAALSTLPSTIVVAGASGHTIAQDQPDLVAGLVRSALR